MGTMTGRTTTEKDPIDRKELEGLLSAVGQGDREAFAALYGMAKGPVYALALSILGHVQEAQDVTQDAFVRIWEKAPGYESRGTAMAWMLTITRNLALMVLRRQARKAELSEEEWAAIPAPASGLSREDSQLLHEALNGLEAEERQVIFLHALSGLKHREIAQLLDIPLSTVLSKYQRGLKKLRIRMEGESI